MTVGTRNYPAYQDSRVANTYNTYFAMPGQSAAAGKSQFGGGQLFDEQTVPQALFQDFQQDFQNLDPLAYNNNWYSQNYPYNANVMAYPVYQPNYTDTSSANMQGNAPLRQNSIPHASLDQFIDNSGFDYDQVLQNLDLTQYSDQFSLEDYADLGQVEPGMNFDDVKQEKVDDSTNTKNLEEMENVLDNCLNCLNSTNDSMVTDNNCMNTESPIVNNVNIGSNPVNIANDQSLDDQNLIEILDNFYSSTNPAEWPTTSSYLPGGNQMVAREVVVKPEPIDNNTNSCDFAMLGSPASTSDEGMPTIGIPDDELIQMPVSRFNELLVSLTPEQSNLAKDIRRRGKNKQAARLCRKRKLDNISTLEETLTQMQERKSRLLDEQKSIVAETEELKSNIEMICEMLMKGLNEQNIDVSELSLLHHSSGQTLFVPSNI